MEATDPRDRTIGDRGLPDAPVDADRHAGAAVEVALHQLARDLGLERRLGTRIDVAARPVDESLIDELFASERSLVDRAVVRRRAEFATGRSLLRSLLGFSGAIGRSDNGAPVVPPGTTVSLAHDIDLAVGVRASDVTLAGIGVDVEPEQDLDPGMVRLIRRPDDELDDPLAVFVAKEAVYKAWSEPGRRILDFHDVRLRPGSPGDRATLTAHVIEDGTSIPVAVTTTADRWVALAVRRLDPR